MVKSKRNQLESVDRLNAIKNATLDQKGDKKKIVVIEYLDIRTWRKDKIIKKPYYNILEVRYYEYSNGYNEVILLRSLIQEWERKSPFSIQAVILNDNEDNLTLTQQYQNNISYKYYDYIIATREYQKAFEKATYFKNHCTIKTLKDYQESKIIYINNVKNGL